MRSLILLLAYVMAAVSAEAGILSNIEGRVAGRTPEGSRLVAGAAEVARGDVVSTGPGSSVTIYHRNGCYQKLRENQYVVVKEAA